MYVRIAWKLYHTFGIIGTQLLVFENNDSYNFNSELW